jgi:hypothetical protein
MLAVLYSGARMSKYIHPLRGYYGLKSCGLGKYVLLVILPLPAPSRMGQARSGAVTKRLLCERTFQNSNNKLLEIVKRFLHRCIGFR